MKKRIEIYRQGVSGCSYPFGIWAKLYVKGKMESSAFAVRLNDGRVVTATAGPGHITEAVRALSEQVDASMAWDGVATILLHFVTSLPAWIPLPPYPIWTLPLGMAARVALCIALDAVLRVIPVWRRLRMYHGAEHKALNCSRSGLPLTVKNAREQSRITNNCGTRTWVLGILWMALCAQVLHGWGPMLIVSLTARLVAEGTEWVVMRISVRWHSLRGMWLGIVALGRCVQRVTTMEPTDDMLEVALKAVGLAAPVVVIKRGNSRGRSQL